MKFLISPQSILVRKTSWQYNRSIKKWSKDPWVILGCWLNSLKTICLSSLRFEENSSIMWKTIQIIVLFTIIWGLTTLHFQPYRFWLPCIFYRMGLITPNIRSYLFSLDGSCSVPQVESWTTLMQMYYLKHLKKVVFISK